MIAALPMYDSLPIQGPNDALWALIVQGLSKHGVVAPPALSRGHDDLWPVWTDPALVLSQTCGLPYRTRLHGRVTLVATPDYGVPGAPPGYYRSYFVARADDSRSTVEDFDGAALAYNSGESQSGWAAPVTEAAARGIRFRAGPCTGAHLASLRAVAEGRADLAGTDAVTWAIAQAQGLAPPGLKVVGETAPTPGLPYITAPGTDPALLRAALAEAVAALPDAARTALRLRGVVQIPAGAYLSVPNPPPPEAFA